MEYTIVTGVNSEGVNNNTLEVFEKFLKYIEGRIKPIFIFK